MSEHTTLSDWRDARTDSYGLLLKAERDRNSALQSLRRIDTWLSNALSAQTLEEARGLIEDARDEATTANPEEPKS